MTTPQEIKNQHTRRERRRETHSRIAQIAYSAEEIKRIHDGDPVFVSRTAVVTLRVAIEKLESIKAGEE